MEKESTNAKLTEGMIANILCARRGLYPYLKNIVLPNSFLPGWEADLLVVSKDLYAREIEIKISKSDLLSEFRIDGKGTKSISKISKHQILTYGASRNMISNYCVAVPEELVPLALELLPPYAGIISVLISKYSSAKYIRQPKRIPKARKMTEEELTALTKNICQRLWVQRLTGKLGRP